MRLHVLGTMGLVLCAASVAACSGSGGTAATVTPGAGPTASPSPTPSISPTPTPKPSSSPTVAPTATPTPKPSITPSPSPTPVASSGACAIPTPTPGSTALVYVVNDNPDKVEVYAGNPNGAVNEAPLATIAGSNTGLGRPQGIAVDAAGKIYVANASPPSVTVYAANPSGTLNEAPLATIAGSNTHLAQPQGIAVDGCGNIYVGQGPWYTANSGLSPYSVTVYAPNPSGTLNETPIGEIDPTATTMAYTNGGIVLDSANRIYVTTQGVDQNGKPFGLLVYAANPRGAVNQPPVAQINGSNTAGAYGSGIALDAQGRIYVVDNSSSPAIDVYASNPVGLQNEAPLATIMGSNTQLFYPGFIAVDAAGNIYVDDPNGGLNVFAPNPSGSLNEAPAASINAGNNALLNQPSGIALH